MATPHPLNTTDFFNSCYSTIHPNNLRRLVEPATIFKHLTVLFFPSSAIYSSNDILEFSRRLIYSISTVVLPTHLFMRHTRLVNFPVGVSMQFTGCEGCTLQVDGTLQVTVNFTYWNNKGGIFLMRNITNATLQSYTSQGVIEVIRRPAGIFQAVFLRGIRRHGIPNVRHDFLECTLIPCRHDCWIRTHLLQ